MRNHLSSFTVEPEAFQKAMGGGRRSHTENCKLSGQIDRGWGWTVDNMRLGKSKANWRGCKANRQSGGGILGQTVPSPPPAPYPARAFTRDPVLVFINVAENQSGSMGSLQERVGAQANGEGMR